MNEKEKAFEIDKYRIGLCFASSRQKQLEKELIITKDAHRSYEIKQELRKLDADMDFMYGVMKKLLKEPTV